MLTSEDRPWGRWEEYLNEKTYRVKRIFVSPGKRISLQKHLHRSEIWVVVQGNGIFTLDDRTLVIRGEKKEQRQDKGENFHRVERQYGMFMRSIQLPSEVVADKVTASFKNGVLEVRLPKSEEAKPKRVAIDVKK